MENHPNSVNVLSKRVNEKLLKDLMKLEPNKRCADCRSSRSSYACLTVGSFVCADCTGVLREFNFKVKSLSMSSFSSNEVKFLKARGNAWVDEVYMNRFHTVHPTFGADDNDTSNLRTFLSRKYIEKRWFHDVGLPAVQPRSAHPKVDASIPPLQTSKKTDNSNLLLRRRALSRRNSTKSVEEAPGLPNPSNIDLMNVQPPAMGATSVVGQESWESFDTFNENQFASPDSQQPFTQSSGAFASPNSQYSASTVGSVSPTYIPQQMPNAIQNNRFPGSPPQYCLPPQAQPASPTDPFAGLTLPQYCGKHPADPDLSVAAQLETQNRRIAQQMQQQQYLQQQQHQQQAYYAPIPNHQFQPSHFPQQQPFQTTFR